MTILLRNRGDQLYYGGGNRWVPDVSVATRFEAINRAVQKALEFPARSIVVVLRYEDYQCELTLEPSLFSQALNAGAGFPTSATRKGWRAADKTEQV